MILVRENRSSIFLRICSRLILVGMISALSSTNVLSNTPYNSLDNSEFKKRFPLFAAGTVSSETCGECHTATYKSSIDDTNNPEMYINQSGHFTGYRTLNETTWKIYKEAFKESRLTADITYSVCGLTVETRATAPNKPISDQNRHMGCGNYLINSKPIISAQTTLTVPTGEATEYEVTVTDKQGVKNLSFIKSSGIKSVRIKNRSGTPKEPKFTLEVTAGSQASQNEKLSLTAVDTLDEESKTVEVSVKVVDRPSIDIMIGSEQLVGNVVEIRDGTDANITLGTAEDSVRLSFNNTTALSVVPNGDGSYTLNAEQVQKENLETNVPLSFTVTNGDGLATTQNLTVNMIYNNPPTAGGEELVVVNTLPSSYQKNPMSSVFLDLPVADKDIEENLSLDGQIEDLSIELSDISISNGGAKLSVEKVDGAPSIKYELPTDPMSHTEDETFKYQVIDSGNKRSEKTAVKISPPDFDGDKVIDATDSCPTIKTDVQKNTDSAPEYMGSFSDIYGDVCDPDESGDGVLDQRGKIIISNGNTVVTNDAATSNEFIARSDGPLNLNIDTRSLAPPDAEDFVEKYIGLKDIEWSVNNMPLDSNILNPEQVGVQRISVTYQLGNARGKAVADIAIVDTAPALGEVTANTLTNSTNLEDDMVSGGRYLLSDGISNRALPGNLFLSESQFDQALTSMQGSDISISGVSHTEVVTDLEVHTSPGGSTDIAIRLPHRMAVGGWAKVLNESTSPPTWKTLDSILYGHTSSADCPARGDSSYNAEAAGKNCVLISATDGDPEFDADGMQSGVNQDGVIRLTLATQYDPIDCGQACEPEGFQLNDGDHAELNLDRESGTGRFGSELFVLVALFAGRFVRRKRLAVACIEGK